MEKIFKMKKSEKIRYMDGIPQILNGIFFLVSGILIYLLILDVFHPSKLNFLLSVISLFLIISFTTLFIFYYTRLKNFLREKFVYDKTGYFSPKELPLSLKIILLFSLFLFIISFLLAPYTDLKIFKKLILLPHFLFSFLLLIFFFYSFLPEFLISSLFSFAVLFAPLSSDIKFFVILIISGLILFLTGVIRCRTLKKS